MTWENLSHPWRSCLHEAWGAYCTGSAPIGAVITNRNGAIISRGRNSIRTEKSAVNRLAGSRVAHAEMNALAGLDRNIQPEKCILYTTTEPCPMCTGAIRICQIGQVHYASRDSVGGSIEWLKATPFMRKKPVSVVGPQDPELEALVVGLHVAFRLQVNDAGSEYVIESWRDMCSTGVKFGCMLFESGQLRLLSDQQSSTEKLFSDLESLFHQDNDDWIG